MAKGKQIRNPNGYGSIVKLSGTRRKPYEVRVNTHMDERNYPKYDVLGRYVQRADAMIALGKYNEKPYDIRNRNMTFTKVYENFYKNKFELNAKKFSRSTSDCTKLAYKRCSTLYEVSYKNLHADDFKSILGQMDAKGNPLSHSLQEHIKNLFSQMDQYASENDIIEKAYSCFAKITVEEDDEPGVPFTKDEIKLLWENSDKPFIDTILIFCYSGWRIGELLIIPSKDIDLENMTFLGGIKTESSKNRIVPIHSGIQEFVKNRLSNNQPYLIMGTKKYMNKPAYLSSFKQALLDIGITTYHTPHDCRHTFSSMLNSAGANEVCIDRLLGHVSKGITKKVYTHKDIEELREAIEMIKING